MIISALPVRISLQRQISVKSWNANDTPTTVELTFVNGNKVELKLN